MKVAIIGSGVASLALSIRLAKNGFQVEVFERNSYPGGKLTELKIGDYRFDAGPSLFTLPDLVEELYEVAEADASIEFPYIKKKITCQYFWEDGTCVTAYADLDKFAKEVEEKLKVDRGIVKKYLKNSKLLYSAVGKIFIEKSLHKFSTWFSTDVLKALGKIFKFDLNKSMHEQNESRLKNKKLVQLFDRYATYNGSNPFKAPALLNMIPHLEFNIGTFFPKNGMHQITLSLFDLALRSGVKFNFNEAVEEILVENSSAVGIKTKRRIFKADKVVSNMDIYPTYKKLLSKQTHPEKTLAQERSSSAIIFYWCVETTFEQLDLHNIFFSNDYEEEFDCLFNKRTISNDPTVYLNITSKNNKTDAPQGCENWFLLVNAPSNQGQDWDVLIDQCRSNINDKLTRILKKDISKFIVGEEVLDPRKIESKTSSFAGSLYGTSSNNKYAAFLRHKNYSSKINQLFFCGGSVHPGGGIPLCLNSAKITSQLIVAS